MLCKQVNLCIKLTRSKSLQANTIQCILTRRVEGMTFLTHASLRNLVLIPHGLFRAHNDQFLCLGLVQQYSKGTSNLTFPILLIRIKVENFDSSKYSTKHKTTCRNSTRCYHSYCIGMKALVIIEGVILKVELKFKGIFDSASLNKPYAWIQLTTQMSR